MMSSSGSMPESLTYRGTISFPKEVCVGYSDFIAVRLKRAPPHAFGRPTQFFGDAPAAFGNPVKLRIQGKQVSLKELELECQAPKIIVEGHKQQRQPLRAQSLFYHWTCHFGDAGHMQAALLPRICPAEGEPTLDPIYCPIKVVQQRSIAQKELVLWRGLFALVTFISFLVSIIVNWPLVLHILGLR